MGDLPRKMLVRAQRRTRKEVGFRKRTTREVRAQTAHSKRGRVRKRTTQKVRAQTAHSKRGRVRKRTTQKVRAQTTHSKRGRVRKRTTWEMVMKSRSDKCWKQYIMVNMHVCFCYLSWKHRSPFRRKPLRSCFKLFSWNEISFISF